MFLIEFKSYKILGVKDIDYVDGVLFYSEVVRDGISEISLFKEVGILFDY